jgi:hypothetical protein
VVAVVRTLHLDDPVAAARGAGHPDGVHGRLGARVDQPHLLEVEPLADLLGQRHRLLGGHGEVRPVLDGLRDRFHDLRVRVAHDVDTEPAVAVHVLGPVHVPDVRAPAALEVDRIGVAGLEVGGDAVGQAFQRAPEELLGGGGPLQQALGLGLGDLGRSREGTVDVGLGGHGHFLLSMGREPGFTSSSA